MGSRISLCGLAFITILSDRAECQIPNSQPASEIRKEFTLGRHLGGDLESKDGVITDSDIIGYVQEIANRLSGTTPARSLTVRISRGSDVYANLMPHDVLYISGALLERLDNEAELAGLLAHQLAHLRGTPTPSPRQATTTVTMPRCVLASQRIPSAWSERQREPELLATKASIQILSAAGYEPSAVLDLHSKLAYEHPLWAKALVPEDLLTLRVSLEADVAPHADYVIDTSAFAQHHARLLAALGHTKTKPSLR